MAQLAQHAGFVQEGGAGRVMRHLHRHVHVGLALQQQQQPNMSVQTVQRGLGVLFVLQLVSGLGSLDTGRFVSIPQSRGFIRDCIRLCEQPLLSRFKIIMWPP